MALSQDEQRMLAEIERRLAADDPGLASCLTTFRRPGPVTVLRSPRARIIGSLLTVLLVAMVSLMVYAMIPYRTHPARPPQPTAGAPTHASISAAITQPDRTPQSSAGASTSTKATTSQSAAADQSTTDRSTGATATGRAQQTAIKPSAGTSTNAYIVPDAGP
jgi:cytoskeletal protein RodZ